jgi:hypothetical protein
MTKPYRASHDILLIVTYAHKIKIKFEKKTKNINQEIEKNLFYLFIISTF